MLCACLISIFIAGVFSQMHGHHARSAHAEDSMRHHASLLKSSPRSAEQKPQIPFLNDFNTQMPQFPPFVTARSEVLGVADASTQTVFGGRRSGWAGAARALLHGIRQKMAVCSQCTILSCGGGAPCSGHCRKNKKLYVCETRWASENCEDFIDPVTTAPSALYSNSSLNLEISTNSPFIPCANVTGLPNGCPPTGTAGARITDGAEYTVLESQCEQYLHPLPCPSTPFFPFGYCSCEIEYSSGVTEFGPCHLSEVTYTGPDLSETGDVPVRVFPEGETHKTTFGDKKTFDHPHYEFTKEFVLPEQHKGPPPVVDMLVWFTHERIGDHSAMAMDDYVGRTQNDH